MASAPLYLASASPRRRELLAQIGVVPRVRPVDIDESHRAGEKAADYVERIARNKAEVAWNAIASVDRAAVLAADTVVVLGDRLLGKPVSREDGLAMLALLSGRTHQVMTAVALRDAAGLFVRRNDSLVTFRALAAGEAEEYWSTGEPADKAGGYAIQGRAAEFIERLEGSYSGVMGLPLFETAQLLSSRGLLARAGRPGAGVAGA
jgi:septum formation protein